jgi:hypothetical protein
MLFSHSCLATESRTQPVAAWWKLPTARGRSIHPTWRCRECIRRSLHSNVADSAMANWKSSRCHATHVMQTISKQESLLVPLLGKATRKVSCQFGRSEAMRSQTCESCANTFGQAVRARALRYGFFEYVQRTGRLAPVPLTARGL